MPFSYIVNWVKRKIYFNSDEDYDSIDHGNDIDFDNEGCHNDGDNCH